MPNRIRITLLAAALCLPATAAAQTTTYTASWTSLNKHTAAPEWFQDAKFGIYFHWGAYSVPAFYNEWYPRWMFQSSGNTGNVYNHHLTTYGDPLSSWGYDKFLVGANDKTGHFTQFAPKLVSN